MEKGDTLSDADVVIRPTREEGEPLLGANAIMVTIPSELRFMADLSHAERAVLKNLSPFELFIAKKPGHLPFALAGPILGAPHGVMVMEKLIALGAKRIWVFGWCGSLQPYLLIGDLVIPTTALCEEGTSAHYPANKKTRQTSAPLNKTLEQALVSAKLSFEKGPVWTTDAIYRETNKKVKAYGKQGLLAVEMEMSALITLACYRSVELAGLLIVSDELFTLEWHNGFGGDKLKERSREASHVLTHLCIDGTLGVRDTL
jgi:uridine phosphorylase